MPSPTGPSVPKVAPHPFARRVTVLFTVLAVVPLLCAGLTMLAGGWSIYVLPYVALSGGALWLGRHYRAQLTAVKINNAAFQRMTRGQLDEAEALLASIPPRGSGGVVGRAMAGQRALIALERGNLDEAVRQATLGAKAWTGIANRSSAKSQRAGALGLRGLAYAAKGELAKAQADAEAAEAIGEATPEAVARAGVVRAIVLSRGGKHDELAAYLAANAPLLLEYAEPKERAIVRALSRMTRGAGKSVYREPAKPGDEDAPTKIASFVALLAPEAASFADDRRPIAATLDTAEAMPASAAHVNAILEVRARAARSVRSRSGTKVIGLWLLLVFMFLAIWQFLTPAERHAPPPRATPAPVQVEADRAEGDNGSFAITLAGGAVVMVGLVALVVLLRGRVARKLARAKRAAAVGDVDGARRTLWSLANHANALVGATANYELARIAARAGAFPDAVGFCEAGLRRVAAPATRANASDILFPGLVTELAVAQAALGRTDESAAELAILAREFPDYAYLSAAQLRARLVAAARDEDWTAAARVACERTAELPIPRREELLADLAVAATSTTGDDERHRLASELADASLAHWIDAVAPRLRERALGKRG
jgi:hypothetical protein